MLSKLVKKKEKESRNKRQKMGLMTAIYAKITQKKKSDPGKSGS